ncbi:MAG: hypothetical protein ACJ8JD_12760, partial [Chthoniobacterales bacterium]
LGGEFSTVHVLATQNITISGDAIFDGSVTTLQAGGDISIGAVVSVDDLVSTGGAITAASIAVESVDAMRDLTVQGGSLAANSVHAGGQLRLMDVSSISNRDSTSSGDINFTPGPFSLEVGSIVSSGESIPALTLNGGDAVSNIGNNNPGNGGFATINITNGNLTIGSGNDLAGITANGGMFSTSSTGGGNGGTINITTSGDFSLNNGSITATSGLLSGDDITPRGNGGTANVTAGGAINVASKIEVSSNDPAPTPAAPPHRRSKQGGNISLTSNKAGGDGRAVAINVTNSGQLLSLLNAAAPGPGGKVVIRATGESSDLNVKGRVQADRGTVDIRHTGPSGVVNLDGRVPTNATGTDGLPPSSGTLDIRADTVKVATLGTNGILKIGGGSISADTTMQLYSTGFNGEVQFIANVSLNGNSVKSIAGNAVTILNNVAVNVTGPAANVYVNSNGQGVPNANYTGSGGNGSTTGQFTGSRANNPQPFANRPPLDPVGGSPTGH